MIIKRILILFTVLLTIQVSWAQEKQPALGILKLEASDISEHKVVKINKYIESAFYKSSRFNIVTRQLLESINQEREGQKENLDKTVIQQGKAIGADYIVKGFAEKYKNQIYRSSPNLRTPYSTRSSSTSRNKTTSPRTSTKTTTKKESKPRTLTNTPPKQAPNSTTKTSPRNPGKTETTTPVKPTSKPQKGQTSSTQKNKTSPLRNNSSSSSTKQQARQPSKEIDRVYNSTQISFTITIIDVKTGVIAAEENYRGSINGIGTFVQKIVRETFPYEFSIVEIMEMKGSKKAKHLLVDGGFMHGLKYGMVLKAYEITEENVEGKVFKREMLVGQLYVKKVDTGGHFSLCTIYKGKKEILAKMNAGVNLVLKQK